METLRQWVKKVGSNIDDDFLGTGRGQERENLWVFLRLAPWNRGSVSVLGWNKPSGTGSPLEPRKSNRFSWRTEPKPNWSRNRTVACSLGQNCIALVANKLRHDSAVRDLSCITSSASALLSTNISSRRHFVARLFVTETIRRGTFFSWGCSPPARGALDYHCNQYLAL